LVNTPLTSLMRTAAYVVSSADRLQDVPPAQTGVSPMQTTKRSGSPFPSRTSERLRVAIDRFLAGKLTPTQLQSWCYAHVDPSASFVDEAELQFWQLTLTNLAIFHHCDFHRSILEQSLVLLMESMDTSGRPCATPLTSSECFYEMKQRERRSGDPISAGF
jgi:hypothetical protein